MRCNQVHTTFLHSSNILPSSLKSVSNQGHLQCHQILIKTEYPPESAWLLAFPSMSIDNNEE